MSDNTRNDRNDTRIAPETWPDGSYGPESSIARLWLHPRLRQAKRLPCGCTLRVTAAYLNPRRMLFTVTPPKDANNPRFLIATQQYGSAFAEIEEIDPRVGSTGWDVPPEWARMFVDPEREPAIARLVLKSIDIQWPLGPRGVKRRVDA